MNNLTINRPSIGTPSIAGPGAAGVVPGLGGTAGANAATIDQVQAIAATRQPIDWFLSDGATTNRRVEWTLGAAGNVAGSALSEVGHVFRVPTSNPSAEGVVWSYSASATTAALSQSYSAATYIGTAGTLEIRVNDSTTGNRRIFNYAGFRAAYSGQIVRLDVVLTSGTANPTVYINGVDSTSLFTLSTAGTPPDWMSASLVPTFRVCGFNWPGTEFRPGTPINRALTAAEVAQMVQTGALLPVDRLGGSMVSDVGPGKGLSLGATDANVPTLYTPFNSTVSVVAGARTGGAGAYFERISATGVVPDAKILNLSPARFGAGVRIRGWARRSVGSTATGLGIYLQNTGAAIASAVSTKALPTADVWEFFDFNVLATSPYTRISFAPQNSSIGDQLDLDDVEVFPLGALLQPEITRTAQVLDHGTNRIRGIATAGVRPLCDCDPCDFEFTLTTTGAFVTGASTNPLWFESGYIREIEALTDTAGADLTLRNNSSSTNNIVTALTDIPTANQWTPLTLIDAQRAFSAGSTLWGSSSAGTIRIRGRWSRA